MTPLIEPLTLQSKKSQRLKGRLRVWTWLLADAVRRKGTSLAAEVVLALARGAKPVSEKHHLRGLMASQRFAPSEGKTAALRSALRDARLDMVDLLPDDVTFEEAANRSIVLLPPRRAGTRPRHGVLLVKFTETLRFYAHHVDVERLQRYFRLIVEPSWAGYALPELLFLHDAPDPIVVESAELTDRQLLERLDSALVPVPMGSGEWVDHRVFRPLGLDPYYDAVCVGNYDRAKRVPIFLRAVRDIVRTDGRFRAALVCSTWGGGRQTVLDFIDRYGLRDHVVLYEDLSQEEVNEVLNRSRCNVLVSLKEGSNRSLFEAMFAGIPGIVLEENVGVNKDLFTADTGVIATEERLPEAILRTVRRFDTFSPREWAMTNISPQASTKKLAAILDELFPEDGPHHSLLVKTNRPEARYFDEDLRSIQTAVSATVLSCLLRGSPEPRPECVYRSERMIRERLGGRSPGDRAESDQQ